MTLYKYECRACGSLCEVNSSIYDESFDSILVCPWQSDCDTEFELVGFEHGLLVMRAEESPFEVDDDIG